MPSASQDDPLARRRLFYRRAALAPVCLLLVAALQAGRVAFCHQSAWKGGGFGMFSTVDTPQSRFLRIHLQTPQGRVPVEVPSRWKHLASELCTAPSASRIEELAERLAQETWIDEAQRWAGIATRIAQSDPQTIDPSLLRNRDTTPAAPLPPRAGARSAVVAAGSIDARREQHDAIAVERVDVELWRYTYDRLTRRVVATRWLAAQAAPETP